jgi:hypothetical protein
METLKSTAEIIRIRCKRYDKEDHDEMLHEYDRLEELGYRTLEGTHPMDAHTWQVILWKEAEGKNNQQKTQ